MRHFGLVSYWKRRDLKEFQKNEIEKGATTEAATPHTMKHYIFSQLTYLYYVKSAHCQCLVKLSNRREKS